MDFHDFLESGLLVPSPFNVPSGAGGSDDMMPSIGSDAGSSSSSASSATYHSLASTIVTGDNHDNTANEKDEVRERLVQMESELALANMETKELQVKLQGFEETLAKKVRDFLQSFVFCVPAFVC